MAICTDSLEINPLATPPLAPPERRRSDRRRRTGAARGVETRMIGAAARTILVVVRGALRVRRRRLAITCPFVGSWKRQNYHGNRSAYRPLWKAKHARIITRSYPDHSK